MPNRDGSSIASDPFPGLSRPQPISAALLFPSRALDNLTTEELLRRQHESESMRANYAAFHAAATRVKHDNYDVVSMDISLTSDGSEEELQIVTSQSSEGHVTNNSILTAQPIEQQSICSIPMQRFFNSLPVIEESSNDSAIIGAILKMQNMMFW